MQVGLGYPATKSGFTMLSLMGGFIFSSTITGQLVTRTGHFKPFMLGGGVMLILGITLLCFIGPDTTTFDLAWRLLIFGIGLGPGQSLFSLAVQNDTPPHRMGVATSSSQFVRQIGSTMGVALFGALLTSSLASELAEHARANPAAQIRQLDMGDLQKMAVERSLHPEAEAARMSDPKAQAEERMIRESFSVAIVHGLMFSLAVLIVGFVLMLMVPAVPLRERHPPPEPEPAVGPAEPPPGAQVKAAE
jgi:Na+/melibiose symporter-like transporter